MEYAAAEGKPTFLACDIENRERFLDDLLGTIPVSLEAKIAKCYISFMYLFSVAAVSVSPGVAHAGDIAHRPILTRICRDVRLSNPEPSASTLNAAMRPELGSESVDRS
jgi:hypothetical protein